MLRYMFQKKLTKKYMMKYSNYDKNKIYSSKSEFTKFLNKLEQEFYTHQFESDKRYVLIGRHRFLIKEMEELYYTKERCKELNLDICPTKWCLDSLIEIIVNPNFLSTNDIENLKNINEIYINKNINECNEIYNKYNSNGIISLQERDCILHALNMIKDSLDKCNENLEWI